MSNHPTTGDLALGATQMFNQVAKGLAEHLANIEQRLLEAEATIDDLKREMDQT